MSLFDLLEQIKANKSGAQYTVSPVENMDSVFFGLDSEDRPAVFFSTKQSLNMPSILTSKIKVEFSKRYKLLIKNQKEQENMYHGVLCLSSDKADVKTFIAVIESILMNLDGQITIQSLNDIFHSLVNLFGVIPQPDALSARKGLWAELFFMQQTRGFDFWAATWHSEPTRLFDFTAGILRTEIKATVKPERIHNFSHNQLVTISNERIVVVSYLLQEDDSGESLQNLITLAKKSFSGTPYYAKLERAIRSASMVDAEEIGPKFNTAYANQNIAWFKSVDVPRFLTLEPSGVSGTHYRSDLSQAPRLSPEEIDKWLDEWTAATREF